MLQKRLNAALETAREVGRFIKERQGSLGRVVEKSSPLDLVTDVDREAQERIFERLQRQFPTDTYWGEESGYSLEDFSSTWVVDPIDGTTNYIHGLPGYTVSIAYYREGEPVVGVIECPDLQETFWASLDLGAYLNGKRITVSQEKDFQRALLGTGFPHHKYHCDLVMPAYTRLMCRSQALRALGSAALGVAYVGCGRLEGYFQLGLSFYDIAAGVCLLREAGGRVCQLDGEPWTNESRTLLASNRSLEQALLEEFSFMKEEKTH